MKKVFVIISCSLIASCATIKQSQVHIHNHSGEVNVEATVQGSDAQDSLNGNDLQGALQIPAIP